MRLPLVSIIIPAYNAASFGADAIQSSLAQTWPNVEVIVIDDGSSDETLEVIKRFGEKIRWISGPNQGACSARNRGLEMARGEYVQFLDSDDLLMPDKVRRCVAALDGHEHALAYSFHEIVSLDPRQPRPMQWNRTRGYEDPIAFMLAGDLQTASPLHRRSVLMQIGGFKESLPAAQDREFHMRIAMAGVRFICVPEALHTIRRRCDSLGVVNIDRVNIERGRIAWAVYQQLSDSDELTDAYRLGCAAMLMKASRGLARRLPQSAREFRTKAYSIHETGGIDQVYSGLSRSFLRIAGPRFTEVMAHSVRSVRQTVRRFPLSR